MKFASDITGVSFGRTAVSMGANDAPFRELSHGVMGGCVHGRIWMVFLVGVLRVCTKIVNETGRILVYRWGRWGKTSLNFQVIRAGNTKSTRKIWNTKTFQNSMNIGPPRP